MGEVLGSNPSIHPSNQKVIGGWGEQAKLIKQPEGGKGREKKPKIDNRKLGHELGNPLLGNLSYKTDPTVRLGDKICKSAPGGRDRRIMNMRPLWPD